MRQTSTMYQDIQQNVALSDKASGFIKAYKKAYNTDPNMFAALAYDSVYMIAEASKGAEKHQLILPIT